MMQFPPDQLKCANCGRELIKSGQKVHNFTYIVGTQPPGACVCFGDCATAATHKLVTTGELGAYRVPGWRRRPG